MSKMFQPVRGSDVYAQKMIQQFLDPIVSATTSYSGVIASIMFHEIPAWVDEAIKYGFYREVNVLGVFGYLESDATIYEFSEYLVEMMNTYSLEWTLDIYAMIEIMWQEEYRAYTNWRIL